MSAWNIDDDVMRRKLDEMKERFSMKPKVAIAGFGKAGKSSLFNAIYGEKVAKVSMKTDETTPETAQRDRTKFGIDFSDTPGFGTERFSVATISESLKDQHVVVHVLNGTSAISADDSKLSKQLRRSPAKPLTVVNKMDLLDDEEREQFAGSIREQLDMSPDQFLFVSAKQGTNVPELVRRITQLLPEAMRDAFIAQQIADLELKQKRVRHLIYAKAALAGAVGLIPLPIADIFIITPIQISMIAFIGHIWGVPITKDSALELMATVGAGMGLREVARQLAKLVPFYGPVISAAIAFGGTVALGQAANAWFKSGMKMTPAELRSVFESAAADAEREYKSKPREPVAADVAQKIDALRKQHEAGATAEQMLQEISEIDSAAPA